MPVEIPSTSLSIPPFILKFEEAKDEVRAHKIALKPANKAMQELDDNAGRHWAKQSNYFARIDPECWKSDGACPEAIGVLIRAKERSEAAQLQADDFRQGVEQQGVGQMRAQYADAHKRYREARSRKLEKHSARLRTITTTHVLPETKKASAPKPSSVTNKKIQEPKTSVPPPKQAAKTSPPPSKDDDILTPPIRPSGPIRRSTSLPATKPESAK